MAHRGWLSYGGRETLASYGLDDPAIFSTTSRNELLGRLRAHIPKSHINFLAGLAYGLSAGGYLFSHASVDPGAVVDALRPRDLLWGEHDQPSDRDADASRTRAPIVIHGHIAQEEPVFSAHEINIDTGAYATGRLTVLCIRPGREPEVF